MPVNVNGVEINSTTTKVMSYKGVIKRGLILHLDAGALDSYPATGTTWYDLSGNGFNATLTNGPTYSTSNGGLIVFDGVDDHALINVNSWIRSTSSAYTFNSFFYYNGSANGGAPYNVMTYPIDINNNDGFWQHLNLGPWYWRTEDNVSGEFGGQVEASSGFINGNWYQESTVVKTNSLSFYRNGILIATVSTTFNWANLRNDGTAYIYIATGYGENYYMNSSIANFQLYNRELSASEISQNYNVQRTRFGL